MSYRMQVCGGLALLGLLLSSPVLADEQKTETVKTTEKTVKKTEREPAADNTKVNRKDERQAGVTADNSKNNKSDLEIARQIRRAVVTDKGLSSYAHNVKIIAQNGKVTLKGPVRSEDEKKTVESRANEVAGESNVTSQLEIAPKGK